MKEKFYITTPIYYTNASPHLGHLYTTVLADVLARHSRQNIKEQNVFFLTGTDEHGAKNVKAAEKAGKNIKEFIDENVAKFQELWQKLDISNDDFIRTSDQKKHWPTVQFLWKKLEEAGDIYKGNYPGLYCVGCEAFITKKDLVDGKCRDHDQKPELIEEENYFFRLSKYTKKIEPLIKNNELRIIPETRKNEILALLKEGLEDVSFSRPAKDISWGISVPGDASQTIYVWADALSNYLSALGYGTADNEKFKKFWPADLHIVGKDIFRFHAAIWPAMLLSAKLPLPKAILVHGFITAGGKKMSKTLGNVVDPFDLVEEQGAEAVRFYLAKAISPFEDGDFTEEKFKKIYNGDLANGLGNFVSRVAAMIAQYFNGIISKPDDSILAKVPFLHSFKSLAHLDNQTNEKVEGFSIPYTIENLIRPEYEKLMEGFELHSALNLVWQFLAELDKYVQDYQPFKLIKTDQEKTQAVLWSLAFGAVSVAWLIKPFLPETGDKILKIFGVPSTDNPPAGGWQEFKITLPKESLFPRKD
ncbi:MAG: methionine--tRNA ligase [Patescibacteria group bacterium]